MVISGMSKHWYVPGIKSIQSSSLPKGPNMTRQQESLIGTSHRDALAFQYQKIKLMIVQNQVEELREFLKEQILRVILTKLTQTRMKGYFKLSTQERLDLALTKGLVSSNIRSLYFQIQESCNPKEMVKILLNIVREVQEGPLAFEPLVSQCLQDQELQEGGIQEYFLNRECVRHL